MPVSFNPPEEFCFSGDQCGPGTTVAEVHVPVQGVFTKTPATYVPKLACGLAHCIAQGVFQMRQHATAASDVKVEGLENQLVNEVMLTTEWEVVKAWNFHWGRVLFPGAILLLCCWTAA